MAAAAALCKSGVARLAGRRLMQLHGADADKFVQAVLTNDMRLVAHSGDALYGAFLTSKGRVVGDCSVVKVADETLLVDYDARIEEDLLKHWKRYKLRMKVAMEDKSEVLSTFAAFGAKVDGADWSATPVSSGVDVLRELNPIQDAQSGVIVEDPRGAIFGARAYLPLDTTLNVPDHFVQLDESTYTDHRIVLGAAEGSELRDGIPLESNLELLHGVSFRKGCYVGQELTARTQFKGNVRKRFTPVALIPSSNQDAVKALSEISFQRFGAPSLQPLRQYLAESASWETEPPIAGDKIVQTGSTKAAGTILTVGKDVSAAVAMMRLEHLLPGESGDSLPKSFTTLDGRFQAVPFQPEWWPELDATTGKMLL